VIEFHLVKNAVKWCLLVLTAIVAALLVALPFALPPLVCGVAETKLAEYGYPARVKMSLGYTWRSGPELVGTLHLGLLNSPWQVNADFGAGLGEWHALVRLPQTDFAETDPLVSKLLASYPQKDVSNLTFNASVALEASAVRTRRMPVPVWSVKAPIRNVSAQLIKEDKPLSVAGLSVTLGASGIADHLDIAPMFLRAAAVDANGFALTNITAAFRATERALLVTEAKAGVCGGSASLYSVFLNPKTLNAGFTLFMDDIDAGDILSHFQGFRGEASGRLHGKLRLFLKEGGKSIRFSDAYLYSTPGETGKLKMADASVVTDNLALAGIDEASRRNVSDALGDLDYSVLKLDLKRLEGDTATLGVRLDGTATRGSRTVPVNLNINFNGKIEQIINTGLGLSERLKGKKRK